MLNLPHTLRLAGAIALFSLSIAAVPAFANDNCLHGNDPKCVDVGPPISATPELDSLVLFGTGLAGAGGYALTRFRARRRHDVHVESGVPQS